jgi:hypothetical protein
MKNRSLPPNILTASRILRELEKHSIEARRTILHFVHQSVEETFQEEQRVGLSELGDRAAADARSRMNSHWLQDESAKQLGNGQAQG